MIVTTSLRSSLPDVAAAYRFATEVNGVFVARAQQSLLEIQHNFNATHIVVIEKEQPVVYQDDSRFRFHRGMSELRMLNLVRSGNDPLIAAMGLSKGMSVLDCTLGLAADALVAAFVVGDSGRVLGLESSPLVCAITRWGIIELTDTSLDVRPESNQAARRIEMLHADHCDFLKSLPDRSFDVVYFDPMFRRGKSASAGILPLRSFADHRPLDEESLRQAMRVARFRVVVKEAHGSREFSRLGIKTMGGGRYSPVQYGILSMGERN